MEQAGASNASIWSKAQRLGRRFRPAALAFFSAVALLGRVSFGDQSLVDTVVFGGVFVATGSALVWFQSERRWTRPGLSSLLFAVLLTVMLVPGEIVPRRTGAEESTVPTEAVSPPLSETEPMHMLGTPVAAIKVTVVGTEGVLSTQVATVEPEVVVEETEPAPATQDSTAPEASPDVMPTEVPEGTPTARSSPVELLEHTLDPAAPTNGMAPPNIGHGQITNADGDSVPLRSEPNYEASALVMVPEGTTLSVLAGPFIAADGSQWWQVTAFDITGYVVEDFLTVDLDAPLEPDPQTDATTTAIPEVPKPKPSPVEPGSGLIANADGDDVRLRSDPGYEASVLLMMPEGTVVQIVDGPTVASDGSRWWQVVALGTTGYVVEDFLSPNGTVAPSWAEDAALSPSSLPAEVGPSPTLTNMAVVSSALTTPTSDPAETPVDATMVAPMPELDEPDPISIEAIATAVVVEPGETVFFSYRVTNDSTTDALVHLSASNSLVGWRAVVLTAPDEDGGHTVQVPAGAGIVVAVEVIVPPEARVQHENTTTLNATLVAGTAEARMQSSR